MTTSRRDFLVRSAALASGAAIPSSLLAAAGHVTNIEKNKPEDVDQNTSWRDVRKHFLLDPKRIHLASLLFASHPRCVRDAIESYRKAFDHDPVHAHDHLDNDKEVIKQAALYMQTSPELIALTGNTTMGLGVMYGGFRFERGDHVITSTFDHYSTREALRFSSVKQGLNVEAVDLYEDGKDADTAKIVSAVISRIKTETRLVAMTWVHSATGVKLPIRAIADALAKVNKQRSRPVLFFVDGVHGFGVEDIAVEQMGCDAFIAGCHKWLFGPRGTGLIWANERGWAAVEPTIPTFNMDIFKGWLKGEDLSKANKVSLMSPGGFHSFEHRWALDEAFKFHLSLGKKRIETRIHALNSYLKNALKNVSGVRLHTPFGNNLSSGIVTFEVHGKTPKQVVEELGKRNITASTTPYATSYARLTPGILNQENEIDAAVAAIHAMVS